MSIIYTIIVNDGLQGRDVWDFCEPSESILPNCRVFPTTKSFLPQKFYCFNGSYACAMQKTSECMTLYLQVTQLMWQQIIVRTSHCYCWQACSVQCWCSSSCCSGGSNHTTTYSTSIMVILTVMLLSWLSQIIILTKRMLHQQQQQKLHHCKLFSIYIFHNGSIFYILLFELFIYITSDMQMRSHNIDYSACAIIILAPQYYNLMNSRADISADIY